MQLCIADFNLFCLISNESCLFCVIYVRQLFLKLALYIYIFMNVTDSWWFQYYLNPLYICVWVVAQYSRMCVVWVWETVCWCTSIAKHTDIYFAIWIIVGVLKAVVIMPLTAMHTSCERIKTQWCRCLILAENCTLILTGNCRFEKSENENRQMNNRLTPSSCPIFTGCFQNII